MQQFLFQQAVPHLADAAVGLGLGAAPVEPALHILVHQQVFQPGHAGVQQTAVLGDVLLLHHADLLVQAAAGLLGPEGRGVHIIVHGLLLGRRDDVGRQQVDGHGGVAGHGVADGVIRVAVVGDGRPPRHDLGVAAHQILRLFAAGGVQIIGVAVQVVEVLQQGKVQRALDVQTVHPLGQMGGQVHRQLLVADGVFQRRLIRRLEVGQQLLLLLFAAAEQRQLAAQLVVRAAAGELMPKPDVFKLGAGHQDHPRAGIRVHRVLIVGFDPQFFPVYKQLGAFFRLDSKRIHRASLLASLL